MGREPPSQTGLVPNLAETGLMLWIRLRSSREAKVMRGRGTTELEAKLHSTPGGWCLLIWTGRAMVWLRRAVS